MLKMNKYKILERNFEKKKLGIKTALGAPFMHRAKKGIF